MKKEEVISLWQEVLENNEIDVSKSFFENGGDSLKAMNMLQIADQKYNYTIDIMTFFENPVIETLMAKEEVYA